MQTEHACQNSMSKYSQASGPTTEELARFLIIPQQDLQQTLAEGLFSALGPQVGLALSHPCL